jgi:hypothetical protein
MSIRFAAAGSGECMVVARVLARPGMARIRLPMADNDVEAAICHDTLLISTLRHFATHGLGAAGEARRLAQEARQQDDRAQYRHWLGVCRHLDQRMADRIEASGRR